MVTELLKKYIWLVQTILRSGEEGLPFTILQDKYRDRFGEEYSRRTFNNHRIAIQEIFDLDIQCNRSVNNYYIDQDQNGEVTHHDAAWLIDTFSVNQLLSHSQTKLKGRVSVEEIPSGHFFLTPVMEAMIDNRVLRLIYKKYNSKEASEYLIQPLAVKEFEKRWYLICDCLEKDGVRLRNNRDPRQKAGENEEDLRIFGLDRVQDIVPMEKTFKIRRDFDVDTLFSTSFGIYLPKARGKTVRFRATAAEAVYLNDLPLHRSQRIVERKDGYVTFEIFAVPDRNMLMTFCKYGSEIEVLSPTEVVEDLKAEIQKMHDLYHIDHNN